MTLRKVLSVPEHSPEIKSNRSKTQQDLIWGVGFTRIDVVIWGVGFTLIDVVIEVSGEEGGQLVAKAPHGEVEVEVEVVLVAVAASTVICNLLMYMSRVQM